MDKEVIAKTIEQIIEPTYFLIDEPLPDDVIDALKMAIAELRNPNEQT